jgi:hypothetical protein
MLQSRVEFGLNASCILNFGLLSLILEWGKHMHDLPHSRIHDLDKMDPNDLDN